MTPRERPPYGFPLRFTLRWLGSWATRRPRALGLDAAWLFRGRTPAPRIVGEEHIPTTGVFVAVMNHSEAPGLRVWWPALLVSSAVATRRGETPPLRWLIADRFFRTRWRGVPIPDAVVAWAFRQVAHAYALIIVSRNSPHARAVALRQASRALGDPVAPRPLGVTPEAALASGGVLATPAPNSALALAWLSRGAIPLVPVAVSEDAAGRLTAHIGEPFTLPWSVLRAARAEQEVLTRRVMDALAALLPRELRGPFAADVGDEPPAPDRAPKLDEGA